MFLLAVRQRQTFPLCTTQGAFVTGKATLLFAETLSDRAFETLPASLVYYVRYKSNHNYVTII